MAARWSSPADHKLFAARRPARLARKGAGQSARGPAPVFSDRSSQGTARIGGATGRHWLPGFRRPVESSTYRAYLAALGRICT